MEGWIRVRFYFGGNWVDDGGLQYVEGEYFEPPFGFSAGHGEYLARIESLSLEGCSLITTEGLETLLLSWNELQHLQVEFCKNIKNSEVSPALSALFSDLKELKWRPDSKSLIVSGLSGTGMGKKGSKFFRKSLRLNPADMYLSNLQF